MVECFGFQSMLAQGDTSEVIIWVCVLIAIVMTLGVGLMFLRKHLIESKDAEKNEGLLLDDLRRLRDQGQLGEEEFRRAVDIMAGRKPPGSNAPQRLD
ncbi:MAG TPA: hypothetical protein ENJ00_09340 [Phycisphaerales bacterium]|nr:hypothetical protein [Phycisphaerales bacterium]